MAEKAPASLAKRLGIETGHCFVTVNEPPGIDRMLGKIPDGAEHRKYLRGGVAIDIILLFVRDKSDLAMRLPSTLSRLREGGVLWLAWPKQSSGVDTDLTRDRIRKLGCAAGVEAGRVITIDKTWAGMRFTK